jgi:serine/threonine protein kinase
MATDSNLEDSLFGIVLQDTYKITGLLGEGGMGAVYDAMQIRLNKRVAIKVMSRDLTSNAEALNRFHREAMITSGLGHPHIVQVFDFSTTPAGQPFLAMEFLAGEDLDRRLSRVGRLTPVQMIHLVKQVASALAATHTQEIVHRDLKPANIYLLNVAGEDDFVKVLDFGISKIRAANTKITKASALIGTPDYMSPEQAMGMGDEVDHRTDQWALACIAWECLAGRAPFFGDSVPSMLFQVVHRDPPSLAALVPGLPRGIEPVLRKALSKEKGDRFDTVTELAQALESVVTGALSGATAAIADGAANRVATTIAVDEKVPYESLSPEERSERPTTTFSQAAKETLPDEKRHTLPPTWRWVAAGLGAAVALVVTAFVMFRPAPAGKPSPATSAASVPAAASAPTAAPAPTPELAPAPAPAPTSAPGSTAAAAPAAAVPAEAPEAPALAEPTPTMAEPAAADDEATADGDAEPRHPVKKAGSARRPAKAGGSRVPRRMTRGRLIKEL